MREKYTAYIAVQKLLRKHEVDIPSIDFTSANGEIKKIQSSLVIGIEYSHEDDELKVGNVTRTVFQKAFLSNGFKITPKEYLKRTPDLFFKVQIRWEPLPLKGAGGQMFCRIFATVELYDDQSRTIGAAVFQSKGGGFDQTTARINALQSIESVVSNNFLNKIIAH